MLIKFTYYAQNYAQEELCLVYFHYLRMYKICVNKSLLIADNLERLFISHTMTVQLEYINHLLQFFKNISYYAGIMLNAFSHLLCSKLCWHNRLVPKYSAIDDYDKVSSIASYDGTINISFDDLY